MESQAVRAESLRQHGHHPASILLRREHEHSIVRVPDEKRLALQPRLHLGLEPRVEHLVQVDVRQERRDDPALWRAGVLVADLARFEHPGLEPLIDRAAQYSVSYP